MDASNSKSASFEEGEVAEHSPVKIDKPAMSRSSSGANLSATGGGNSGGSPRRAPSNHPSPRSYEDEGHRGAPHRDRDREDLEYSPREYSSRPPPPPPPPLPPYGRHPNEPRDYRAPPWEPPPRRGRDQYHGSMAPEREFFHRFDGPSYDSRPPPPPPYSRDRPHAGYPPPPGYFNRGGGPSGPWHDRDGRDGGERFFHYDGRGEGGGHGGRVRERSSDREFEARAYPHPPPPPPQPPTLTASRRSVSPVRLPRQSSASSVGSESSRSPVRIVEEPSVPSAGVGAATAAATSTLPPHPPLAQAHASSARSPNISQETSASGVKTAANEAPPPDTLTTRQPVPLTTQLNTEKRAGEQKRAEAEHVAKKSSEASKPQQSLLNLVGGSSVIPGFSSASLLPRSSVTSATSESSLSSEPSAASHFSLLPPDSISSSADPVGVAVSGEATPATARRQRAAWGQGLLSRRVPKTSEAAVADSESANAVTSGGQESEDAVGSAAGASMQQSIPEEHDSARGELPVAEASVKASAEDSSVSKLPDISAQAAVESRPSLPETTSPRNSNSSDKNKDVSSLASNAASSITAPSIAPPPPPPEEDTSPRQRHGSLTGKVKMLEGKVRTLANLSPKPAVKTLSNKVPRRKDEEPSSMPSKPSLLPSLASSSALSEMSEQATEDGVGDKEDTGTVDSDGDDVDAGRRRPGEKSRLKSESRDEDTVDAQKKKRRRAGSSRRVADTSTDDLVGVGRVGGAARGGYGNRDSKVNRGGRWGQRREDSQESTGAPRRSARAPGTANEGEAERVRMEKVFTEEADMARAFRAIFFILTLQEDVRHGRVEISRMIRHDLPVLSKEQMQKMDFPLLSDITFCLENIEQCEVILSEKMQNLQRRQAKLQTVLAAAKQKEEHGLEFVLTKPGQVAAEAVEKPTKQTRLQALVNAIAQQNKAKIEEARLQHGIASPDDSVTSIYGSPEQSPNFAATRDQMARNFEVVRGEIRRRKGLKRKAWEVLADRFLHTKNLWQRHVEAVEREEEATDREGPRLRGSTTSMRLQPGSGIGGGGANTGGLGSIGGAPGGALGALPGSSIPFSLSSSRAIAGFGLPHPDPFLSNFVGRSSLNSSGPGSGIGVIRSDYERDRLLQQLALSESFKQRIKKGAATIENMTSPWVSADASVPPEEPSWPSSLREFSKSKKARTDDVAEDDPTKCPNEAFPMALQDGVKHIDISGNRLTTDGRRQRCSMLSLPVDAPCPDGCNCARQLDAQSRFERVWSDMEKSIFLDKFLQFPKNFQKIASFLSNRTVADCIKFYYDSKTRIPYKTLLREFENRRRNLKTVWTASKASASSVGTVLFPSHDPDEKECLVELPVDDATFHSFLNHPPFMPAAIGYHDPATRPSRLGSNHPRKLTILQYERKERRLAELDKPEEVEQPTTYNFSSRLIPAAGFKAVAAPDLSSQANVDQVIAEYEAFRAASACVTSPASRSRLSSGSDSGVAATTSAAKGASGSSQEDVGMMRPPLPLFRSVSAAELTSSESLSVIPPPPARMRTHSGSFIELKRIRKNSMDIGTEEALSPRGILP